MAPLVAEVSVTVISVLLCLIGLFGNFSLLWATITDKQLHNKICYIMAVIASLHVICLLSELYIEARQLRFHALLRSECFRHTCVYVFSIMSQSLMFLMMAADYLLAMAIPLRHYTFRTLPYVFYMCIPPLLFGSASVVFCTIFMDDEVTDICTPIQAMPRKVGWLIVAVVNVFNIFILLMLLCLVALVKYKKRQSNGLTSQRLSTHSRTSLAKELKLMLSFVVSTVIFVCSWCTVGILAYIAFNYLRAEQSVIMQTYTRIVDNNDIFFHACSVFGTTLTLIQALCNTEAVIIVSRNHLLSARWGFPTSTVEVGQQEPSAAMFQSAVLVYDLNLYFDNY